MSHRLSKCTTTGSKDPGAGPARARRLAASSFHGAFSKFAAALLTSSVVLPRVLVYKGGGE
jgi:hypothetical protein